VRKKFFQPGNSHLDESRRNGSSLAGGETKASLPDVFLRGSRRNEPREARRGISLTNSGHTSSFGPVSQGCSLTVASYDPTYRVQRRWPSTEQNLTPLLSVLRYRVATFGGENTGDGVMGATFYSLPTLFAAIPRGESELSAGISRTNYETERQITAVRDRDDRYHRYDTSDAALAFLLSFQASTKCAMRVKRRERERDGRAEKARVVAGLNRTRNARR